VCIPTYQPYSKLIGYPNPNPNPNPTSMQAHKVNIRLNIVACPTYQDKFILDMLLHRPFDFRL